MTRGAEAEARSDIRRLLRSGLVLLAVLGGVVGGWAVTTEISGAVVAAGVLVVDSNVKKVQHPTGGVVAEIRARDGDRVSAGDIVVRLDETITRVKLAIVTKALDELAARKARLEAERDGLESVVFGAQLAARVTEPGVAATMNGERKLFELRRSARLGQKDQLGQRIAQLKEEIAGHDAHAAAKSQEIILIQRELVGARELWTKKLLTITKLTFLEREATRVAGERAQLIAATAQAKGKISELELQIGQVDRDLASEVGRELREGDAKTGELIERKVAAEDELKRVEIRSPEDGIVHQSAVHTVGGVVTAGEVILLIVPVADALMVEAKVAPQDIDQVKPEQKVLLRFSAFNQRTTPELNGIVARISADASVDQRTSMSFFVIRIAVASDEVARLGRVRLMPGMPVEAFIQTGERRVISYLVKPLHDQIVRAFRER